MESRKDVAGMGEGEEEGLGEELNSYSDQDSGRRSRTLEGMSDRLQEGRGRVRMRAVGRWWWCEER